MNPAILIVHRDSQGGTTPVPFTYRDGMMPDLAREIGDYLIGLGLVDSFWTGVVGDQLGVILKMRAAMADLVVTVNRQEARIEELSAASTGAAGKPTVYA